MRNALALSGWLVAALLAARVLRASVQSPSEFERLARPFLLRETGTHDPHLAGLVEQRERGGRQ